MAKGKRKIITFEDYLAETMESDTISERFVTSRKNWLKESKTESVLDKISTSELPECEQIDAEHSKIGDFLSADIFTDMYDDEKGELLDSLKDGSLLAYCSIEGETTWWKRRKNKDGDGLIRIR